MAKFSFEDILYNKYKKVQGFDFDKLMGPGIYHLLYESDLQSLYNIATSIKYSGALKKKYAAINDILKPRGFTHFHRGTNRIVYKHYENPNILIKVPIDVAGCSDGMMEFKNQNLLKPFVTKVFDVHPSGVSVHERVMPLTTYAEFANFAYEYFQLVSHVFLGRFVMDDIGEGSFMNWGFRYGFGLVLLDFPYLYELDYQRLICHKVNQMTGQICNGEIDYDDGFNHLVCKKCGLTYNAKDIGKFIQNHNVNIIQKEENDIMGRFVKEMVLVRGNKVLKEFGTNHMESDVIVSRDRFKEVDNIRKQSQPKPVDVKLNIPKPQSFKFVPKKEEAVSVDIAEKQIEKENEEMEQLQSSYEEVGHEEKSETEKFIENVINDVTPNKEQPEEEDTAADADRFQIQEVSESKPEPDKVDEDVDKTSEEQFKEEATSELDELVHSLSVDEVEEKILKHFASLLTLGSKIQAIDDMLKPYVYQKFPNTAQDVYLKYMNAVNRISHFVEGEKAKVMDPIQVQSSIDEQPIDLYEEYFPVVDGWFGSDLTPKGNLPGIDEDTKFVTFDMICTGLKETTIAVIEDELKEKGKALPEDINKIVDKIVQNAINAHMDYIQKWADDVK